MVRRVVGESGWKRRSGDEVRWDIVGDSVRMMEVCIVQISSLS